MDEVVDVEAEGEHPEEVAEAEEVMIINKFFLSMTSLKCFITSLQSSSNFSIFIIFK